MEKKNKNQTEIDGDEDTWDDWGDAEDNFEIPKHSETEPVKYDSKTNKDIKQSSENKKEEQSIEKDIESKETIKNQESVSSWWGGLTTALSTVSQGLNQVIGAPEPEELVLYNKQAVKQTTTPTQPNEPEEDNAATFGKNIVSGVQSLGSKMINTGLDTLEGIGKKTMNILQENDPLLKNKRKLLGLETEAPKLIDVLKEAKNDAEQVENTLKELKLAKHQQQIRFEPLFEEHCGLVHMEALSILSKESELKLQTLSNSISGKALRDLQETINEVKELMEPDDSEIDSEGDYNTEELNKNLCTAIEVDGIVQLCYQFKVHFHGLIHRFASRLTAIECEDAKTCLNVLCGELIVATQQIDNAFNLFLPIIQIGAA